MDTTDDTGDLLQEEIRRTYAAAALQADTGQASCCGPTSADACQGQSPAPGDESDPRFGAELYTDEERAALPEAAQEASLGCGNPLAVADLHEGETVLDLGSGGGGDVLLSARRVGPGGTVHGLDMTQEMLDLARRNVAEAGVDNVTFHQGTIEEVPLPDASVDVVISNCVINLSADKAAVFDQMHRVLRPAGRIGISDVVAEDTLTPDERAARGAWVGCIAGALSRTEYTDGLAAAGFRDIEVAFTHPVADGMHAAVVRAVRA